MILTILQVRNAKPRDKNYKLSDGQGLYLYVTKGGSKSWRFKYRFGTQEKLLTFGLFPEVSILDARGKRDEARALLREGKDPIAEAERKKLAEAKDRATTFRVVAEEWLADQEPRWSDSNSVRVRNRLKYDIFPAIGHLPISDIDGYMILQRLRKIEARGSIETAKRVRGYVLGIFKRARAERLISQEALHSIRDLGDALKPTPRGRRQPALTNFGELLALQRTVDAARTESMIKLGSRLLALTLVRVGVLRNAEWSEFSGIDWDNPCELTQHAIWKIPAEKMKLELDEKGQEGFGHDIPLSTQAVETLRALRILKGLSPLVFPAPRNWRKPITDAALSTVYKRMADGRYKGKMVPHGWRSAFSTLMNERAAELERDGDRLIIDMILAHVPPGVSASEWAYNRARYLKPRAALLQVWSDLISEGLVSPFDIVSQRDIGAGSRRNRRHRFDTSPPSSDRYAGV